MFSGSIIFKLIYVVCSKFWSKKLVCFTLITNRSLQDKHAWHKPSIVWKLLENSMWRKLSIITEMVKKNNRIQWNWGKMICFPKCVLKEIKIKKVLKRDNFSHVHDDKQIVKAQIFDKCTENHMLCFII